jgi:hypothetical protein
MLAYIGAVIFLCSQSLVVGSEGEIYSIFVHPIANEITRIIEKTLNCIGELSFPQTYLYNTSIPIPFFLFNFTITHSAKLTAHFVLVDVHQIRDHSIVFG